MAERKYIQEQSIQKGTEGTFAFLHVWAMGRARRWSTHGGDIRSEPDTDYLQTGRHAFRDLDVRCQNQFIYL